MESDLKKCNSNSKQSVWLQFWKYPNHMSWNHVDIPCVSVGKKHSRPMDDDDEKPPLPVDVDSYHPYMSSCTAMGSVIYCADGYLSHPDSDPDAYFAIKDPLLTITCIDTAEPPTSTKRIFVSKKMTVPRTRPLMASMQGEIYIIGGTDDHSSFGEIFNPQTLQTKVMKPLPQDFPHHFTLIVAHPDHKIIIAFPYGTCHAPLCYYDPHSKEGWGRLPNHPTPIMINEIFSRNYAVVGTTIYWLSHKGSLMFFAYDFVAHKSFQSNDIHDPYLPSLRCLTLLHLHDACFYYIYTGGMTQTHIVMFFKRLQIFKGNADGTLDVSLLSHEQYLVSISDDEHIEFKDALMLNLKADESIRCNAPLLSEVEDESYVST